MRYSNLQKTIALSVGVLAMVILISYIVSAWTEPSQTPPAGNVPAPINTGGAGQTKKYVDASNKGWLGVATDYYDSTYGLTVGYSGNSIGVKVTGNSYFDGNINIKTFKFSPISGTELGVYDSAGNQVIIFDEGI